MGRKKIEREGVERREEAMVEGGERRRNRYRERGGGRQEEGEV